MPERPLRSGWQWHRDAPQRPADPRDQSSVSTGSELLSVRRWSSRRGVANGRREPVIGRCLVTRSSSALARSACGRRSQFVLPTDGRRWGVGSCGEGPLADAVANSRQPPIPVDGVACLPPPPARSEWKASGRGIDFRQCRRLRKINTPWHSSDNASTGALPGGAAAAAPSMHGRRPSWPRRQR
jgi:hypothetical protein